MTCPKCGFEETETFCRKCGTRTETLPSSPAPAEVPAKTSSIQVKLVCPHCEQQHIYALATPHLETITCLGCQKQFDTRLVKIRAKNSRGNKRNGGTRDFTVRVHRTNGGEELIEFHNDAYGDFELRSGDAAVFSYLGPLVAVVQNLTVNKYLKIEVRKTGCYVATYVYGETSREVALLRSFRDRRLQSHSVTRAMVSAYYATSPGAIRWFGGNDVFRALCHGLLKPVVQALGR